MHRFLVILFLSLVGQFSVNAQKSKADSIRGKMEWFGDAKLGIFIHWGMYGVKDVSESWSFHNR